jgi:hypothetical protein
MRAFDPEVKDIVWQAIESLVPVAGDPDVTLHLLSVGSMADGSRR